METTRDERRRLIQQTREAGPDRVEHFDVDRIRRVTRDANLAEELLEALGATPCTMDVGNGHGLQSDTAKHCYMTGFCVCSNAEVFARAYGEERREAKFVSAGNCSEGAEPQPESPSHSPKSP